MSSARNLRSSRRKNLAKLWSNIIILRNFNIIIHEVECWSNYEPSAATIRQIWIPNTLMLPAEIKIIPQCNDPTIDSVSSAMSQHNV